MGESSLASQGPARHELPGASRARESRVGPSKGKRITSRSGKMKESQELVGVRARQSRVGLARARESRVDRGKSRVGQGIGKRVKSWSGHR